MHIHVILTHDNTTSKEDTTSNLEILIPIDSILSFLSKYNRIYVVTKLVVPVIKNGVQKKYSGMIRSHFDTKKILASKSTTITQYGYVEGIIQDITQAVTETKILAYQLLNTGE